MVGVSNASQPVEGLIDANDVPQFNKKVKDLILVEHLKKISRTNSSHYSKGLSLPKLTYSHSR